MNNIKYDKNNIIGRYTEGMESVIYYYKVDNEVVFLKQFKTELNYRNHIDSVTKEKFENKMHKLRLIPEIDCLKNEIQIKDLVFDENGFIGYTMKIDSLTTVKEIKSKRKKIEVLRQLRDKIEVFNENKIYIGDIKSTNILIDESGQIKLCDLDNYKIGDFDFDLPSLAVNVYRKNIKNDENLDNYSFNLFTVSYLQNIFLPYTVSYLGHNGLDYPLNSKINNEKIFSLTNIGCGYTKMYLIDNLRFPYNK